MKNIVTETIAEAVLLAQIEALRMEKYSLRAIAAMYGEPIKHSDIQRILDGVFPVGVDKRLALGLPAFAPARVCPIHGIVELYDCQTQTVKAKPKPKKQPKRYPRYYSWLWEWSKGWENRG